MDKDFKNKLLLITYGVVLYVLLSNYKWIINLSNTIINLIYPFIIGLFIAAILNIIMDSFEKSKWLKKNKHKRGISLILSIVSIIAIIAFLIMILVPEMKKAGSIFIDNIPEYKENLYSIGKKMSIPKKTLNKITNTSWTTDLTKYIKKNYSNILSVAGSIFSALYNFLIGFIFAIYILTDKDNLKRQFNKLLEVILPKDINKKIKDISTISYKSFSDFMKIQCVEACILGSLCFIGMLIFGFPYAAPVSVLVGVTALIPVFGALIGCVIGAFLIFMINPIRSITFIIYFLILQQLENNLIYPHVVGNKVGLPSIWVLVAVIIGGGLGGVIGMLLGIPILSMVYASLRVYVNQKKQERKVEANG